MNLQPWLTADVVGAWIAVFLTFCILSFLYKDNPFYKLAEHLFVGSSVGIVIVNTYYGPLKPNLVGRLWDDHNWWYIIPLVLSLCLFVRAASRSLSWVGRYPVAFVVGLYAGINLPAVADSNLLTQARATASDIVVERVDVNNASPGKLRKLPGFGSAVAAKVVGARKAIGGFKSMGQILGPYADGKGGLLPQEQQLSAPQLKLVSYAMSGPRGIRAQAFLGAYHSGSKDDPYKPEKKYFLFGILSNLLMLAGTLAALVYFYFSVPHKGAVGKVARFGIWTLMLGFGASFGYTVQGRISLAIGRAFSILDKDKSELHKNQVHSAYVALISIVLIVAGIIYFERRAKRRPPPADPSGDGGGVPNEELPQY